MALCEIKLPKFLKKMESMNGDPIDSECYGSRTDDYAVIVMTFPIEKQFSMPYDNLQLVIDSIHEHLGDNQGLIEVKGGLTSDNKKYAYSLVKNLTKETGANYLITMHIDEENTTSFIQVQAGEPKNKNTREKEIFDSLKKDKKIKGEKDGWAADPYDASYTKGALKNLSEDEKYDEAYPNSPLSKVRELVKYIIESN